jgi:hypothetical protein
MTRLTVFIRRQSPDWHGLSLDFRKGLDIDPSRFVPDHHIPAFPADIKALIGQWNHRFNIDFFTCRSIISRLSENNISAIPNSARFEYHQHSWLIDLANREEFHAFFHDDDDFFAPYISQRLSAHGAENFDTVVSPLFRVNASLCTFAKSGHPVDFLWGSRFPFYYRFHTNNYGIHSRICSPEVLRGMKDHILASSYADREDFSELVLPSAISATVKTPCSASFLPKVFSSDAELKRQFEGFITRFSRPDLPPEYIWLSEPLEKISGLLDAVYRGYGYDAIADLIGS